MSDCEHYVEDFRECFRGGNYHQDDASYCELTHEPCAKYDCWSICPKEDEE